MGKKKTHLSKSQNRGEGAPWSELNHDVLFLVMMELRVIDFLSFSRVCKSWRSLALSNKIRFMASKPPMEMFSICEWSNNTDEYSLVDFGGRSFKIILPESGSRYYVGLTCGYLVFFGRKSCDFLLLNPITRHGIRFPKVPSYLTPFYPTRGGLRAILVFSPSIFTWVLVVLCRQTTSIWLSIAGKGEWDCVTNSKSAIFDVHEFKGRIYAIDTDSRLYEVGLDPFPKLTLLKTKNVLDSKVMYLEFVSSDENLYAMECFSHYEYKVYKLDFGEMKWESAEENSTEDFAFFVTDLKHSAAIKPGLWSESDSWSRFKNRRSDDRNTCGKNMFFKADIWYFPHDCLKLNLKHE